MFFANQIKQQLNFKSVSTLKKSLIDCPLWFKKDIVELYKPQLINLIKTLPQFIELNCDTTKPIAFELAKDMDFIRQIIKSEADIKFLFASTEEADNLALYALLNTLLTSKDEISFKLF